MTSSGRKIATTAVEGLPTGFPESIRIEGWDDANCETIATHISHLLLTEDRVYKIRKAVRFPFLSFATRAERNEDCLREVRLNRRLAPDVYLGVAPLLSRDGAFEIGPVAEALYQGEAENSAPEHCVVMRRLPAGNDGQSLLERGELTFGHIDAVADRIARFHSDASLGRPAPYSRKEWGKRVESPFRETLETIAQNAPDRDWIAVTERLNQQAEHWLDLRRDELEDRRVLGRAIDGHGDLQLAHIWFESSVSELSIIDCLEFNDDLRRIDSASEVAFLAMDLEYREAHELAERFLSRYAEQVGDFELYALVDYCAAYRAAVRAKVALLASIDPHLATAQRDAALASANTHLRLASRYLDERDRGSITITCGTIGCGKSTVAQCVARATDAVVISSDRTRKRLSGLEDDDRSGATDEPNAGVYSRENRDAVYAALLELAGNIVDSGRNVVLDASLASARSRFDVLAWASAREVPARLVLVTCAAEVAIERLRQREKQGNDPSDAGPSLLAWSVDHFEPPDEWPEADLIPIETDNPDWRVILPQRLEEHREQRHERLAIPPASARD